MPRCNYCGKEVESMNDLTDHVSRDHDVISAAVRGDINALVDEMQKKPAKP